jgi:hypothetical protein
VAGGGADEDDALAGVSAAFGQAVAEAGLHATGPHGTRQPADAVTQ